MPEGRGRLVLIKLGGSLITDKRRPSTLRRGVLRRLAGELAGALRRGGPGVVLGHGSGSFGHTTAKRYGLTRAVTSQRQVAGVAQTRLEATLLHRRVLEALRETGLKPLSWAPSSAMVLDDGRPVVVHDEPIVHALELGMVPVLFGDVVTDRTRGAAICSTETALLAVARRLRRRGAAIGRALWLGETAGVLDADGGPIPVIDAGNRRSVLAGLRGASGPDVTGGIRHRVETAWALARLGVPSSIVDGRRRGTLRRLLAGQPVTGTEVRSG